MVHEIQLICFFFFFLTLSGEFPFSRNPDVSRLGLRHLYSSGRCSLPAYSSLGTLSVYYIFTQVPGRQTSWKILWKWGVWGGNIGKLIGHNFLTYLLKKHKMSPACFLAWLHKDYMAPVCMYSYLIYYYYFVFK